MIFNGCKKIINQKNLAGYNFNRQTCNPPCVPMITRLSFNKALSDAKKNYSAKFSNIHAHMRCLQYHNIAQNHSYCNACQWCHTSRCTSWGVYSGNLLIRTSEMWTMKAYSAGTDYIINYFLSECFNLWNVDIPSLIRTKILGRISEAPLL